ncbi:SAM-dependent methyltransferase, partial [Patescibacteria group bacterium]|nr:SAM-dependent methyltransferase [Patescibacteria group bacterium]
MITAAYGIALLLFVLIASAYIWESGRMNRPGRIVYAASDRKQVYPLLEVIIQQYILDAGQETGGYHLVEPGAGLAILSSRLARKYPWQSVTAIELGI